MKAISPHINATVTASAGSGKTWQLVSRILRLMLEGHAPGGILALTFTRKAAAEMQQRLTQRLYQLATVDDAKLEELLQQIDLQPTPPIKHSARALYQQHQYCDFPLRAQTFHAFCQDILARFPLEADVPPGFALLDNETLLKNQAREALFNQAALNMHSDLAQQLQDLMQACGSYEQLKKALDTFISHRSDWLAYSDGSEDPTRFAAANLLQKLSVDLHCNPFADFFTANTLEQLETFILLLAQHPIATNLKVVDAIRGMLSAPIADASFAIVQQCFLTEKGEARKTIKDSKTLRAKLGDKTDTLLLLNTAITDNVLAAIETHHRQQTFHLNQLWYGCGEHYLQQYQKLKRDMRLLDFADLEWKTFQLLRDADNAHWVQYKLDQRIDHLLIDEFQDTNPTQWQLLLPLLEEMAAGESDRSRSVFLVGDEKQSIYSFRRAKPELQAIASTWLANNLHAQSFPLNKSWRSSPAIIEFVNALFAQDELRALLPHFPQHETNKPELPGEVMALPMLEATKEDAPVATIAALRNPLHQPRDEPQNLHDLEGQQIAQQIKQLFDHRIAIRDNDVDRAISYNDIFILLRKRSHVASYEKALRNAGIPYIGANRGSLLDCIEIDDMLALLDALLTPFNNLALAQLLKSPFFAADDNDLMRIAAHKSTPLWIDRLAEIAVECEEQHPLRRAHDYLQRWSALADRIPVHDLLDHIYHQSQLVERYVASTPPALKPRVRANLIRFLEMALDLDSGRYPSLMHFLLHIRELQQQERDAPDEAPMQTDDARVKIMTIHASKGLEAPVVFLADTINVNSNKDSLAALIDWPAQDTRPAHIQLIPASDARDAISEQYLAAQKHAEAEEQSHLLYVAVTRAKQCLYISGCRPEKNIGTDWYTPIANALRGLSQSTDASPVWRYKTLLPAGTEKSVALNTQTPALPPFYFNNISQLERVISPSLSSNAADASGDEDGQQRGIIIHRALDLLSRQPAWTLSQIRQLLSAEMMLSAGDALISECLNAAQTVINEPTLNAIFAPATTVRAVNECSLSYKTDKGQVIGVIDRLLISATEIVIVDYKTHRIDAHAIAALAEKYTAQMRHYAQGARLAWPGRAVKSVLLFTHCRKMIVVDA